MVYHKRFFTDDDVIIINNSFWQIKYSIFISFRIYIYIHFTHFYSNVLFYIHSNKLIFQILSSFDKLFLSLADKVKSGIYKLVYLIAKTILVALSLSLTLPLLFAEKTQDFVHLQLINAISSDLQIF